jgi:signal transduction histidine kinase
MGGDLVSDPPADGGARFVLTLPLAKPVAQPCA